MWEVIINIILSFLSAVQTMSDRFQIFDLFILLQQHTHKNRFDRRLVGNEGAGGEVDFRRAPHFVEEELVLFSQCPAKLAPCLSLFVDDKREGIVVASHM